MKTAMGRPRPLRSFRMHLQAELARRCADNPRYSLRAFARDLRVNHATLSQILRGERTITARTIDELGAAMDLSAAVIAEYVAAEPLAASSSRQGAAELARDVAEVLAEWHHFALLELTHLDSFRPDVRWIAQVLGLSTDEVSTAVSRLLRLRLLELRGDRWIDASGDSVAHADDFTRVAIERLFEQVRSLTAASIANGEHPHRSHGVTTTAASSRKLPEAVAAIEKCRVELAALLTSEPADTLVHIEMHLFPFTAPTKES